MDDLLDAATEFLASLSDLAESMASLVGGIESDLYRLFALMILCGTVVIVSMRSHIVDIVKHHNDAKLNLQSMLAKLEANRERRARRSQRSSGSQKR